MIGPILRAVAHKPAAAVLIILEVGFGFSVAVQAVNLGRWFQHVHDDPTGMSSDVVVVCAESAAPAPDRDDAAASRKRDLAILRDTPGVLGATSVRRVPMARGLFPTTVRAGAATAAVWPIDGFASREVLGIELLAGRDLTAADAGKIPLPVLVDEDVAAGLFGDGPSLGRTVVIAERPPAIVVGVTRSFRVISAFAPYSHSTIVYPDQPVSVRSTTYLLRTAPGAADATRTEVVARLSKADPERALSGRTLSEMRDDVDRSARGGGVIFNFMVAVVVLVVLTGSFAMVSFLVAERTKTIGMRRALGATRRDIVSYFIKENSLLTCFGVILGLPLTYALNALARIAQPDLYIDWQSLIVGVILFVATGEAAAVIPAMRAARVPPTVATRSV